MKTKHLVHILTLLLALGTVAFFVARPDAQTADDPWEAWVDEQTDTVLKSAGEMDAARRAETRAKVRKKFATLAKELKNDIASPPKTRDYVILQTVKELRDAYDTGYNSKHKDTTVRVSYTVGDAEIFAYDESVPLAEVDAKYPRE
jgi:nitrogen fixation/metabolism regulation signal transduction histidine kinase